MAASRWRCPGPASLDVSYVGNHGFNRLGDLQGGTTVNLNAVDFGAAYLPQNQDPTQTSTRARCQHHRQQPARTYRGLGNINQNTTEFHDTYHSIQTSLNRRFRDGFAFGVNYTYSISWKGNTGLAQAAASTRRDGTISVRADQARLREAAREPREHPAHAQGERDLGHALGS